MHTKLLEMTSRYQALEIECSDADEVDLAFVQLLLAAFTSANLSGRIVKLARPASGALLETLQRGGFLSGHAAADQVFWLNSATP
jgi:hypothetical protein